MIIFWSIAAIIWLLLLAVLLKPLLHRRQSEIRSQRLTSAKSRSAIAVLITLFVIASSALLYVYWSNGYSLLVASSDEQADMVQLTEQLAGRLEQSPDNPEGWLLLASSYASLGLYDKAVVAYAQAERYTELESWAQVGYAEALLVAEGALNAKAKDLLEAAIRTNPDDPQALFLIGLAHLEQSDYSQTISYWERLSELLEEDSALADAVAAKLVEVRKLAAEASDGAADEIPTEQTSDEQVRSSPPMQTEPTDTDCYIRVEVRLAAELSERISPADTLFVYAKATSGPPMPLAIKQFKTAVLPLQTCLGPDDTMIEGMTINSFDPIKIVARISKSGLAAPQVGDLQAQSSPLPPQAGEAVSLLINEVIKQ